MPRMSLAGSSPMGSSMRFTGKKIELPAQHTQMTVCQHKYKDNMQGFFICSHTTHRQTHTCIRARRSHVRTHTYTHVHACTRTHTHSHTIGAHKHTHMHHACLHSPLILEGLCSSTTFDTTRAQHNKGSTHCPGSAHT